jgi:hypothetical protein
VRSEGIILRVTGAGRARLRRRVTAHLRHLFLLACISWPSAALAQDSAELRVTEAGVHLNFQDADLRVVVTALAELAGLTVIHSGLPNRPVTLRSPAGVSRSELRALLESVVRSNGLELVEEGSFIRVVDPVSNGGGVAGIPPSHGGAAFGSLGEGSIRLFVHRLRHTKAEVVAQTIREVFGLGDRGVTDAGGGRRPLSEELRRQRLHLPAGGGLPDDQPPPMAGVADGGASGLTTGLAGCVQIVPDALRPYVGRVMAGYIDDVHWRMADIIYPHEDLPGDQQLHLTSAGDLKILLAELGKNGEARDTIMMAEELYLASLYDHYLSGSGGGRDYTDEALLAANGIGLRYDEFTYPVYPQLWGPFEPNLSVLDLLFNCGAESRELLLEGGSDEADRAR